MFSRNDLNLNTSCPITLDEFREGDLLTQIRRCGHLFNQRAIQNWFSRNVRCPVCRYDIRTRVPVDNSGNEDAIINDVSANYATVNNNNNEEYISSDEESDADENSPVGEESRSDREEVENLLSTITNNISNIIQNYVNNSENTTNDNNNIVTTSIYTFEIRGDDQNTTTDEEKTDNP
jgi:hypothetical protein